ncbi:MAG: heme NO-binding domain-containing protein [Ktedonobacteraceae bacterium]|nr:heme NO-binding domain-containing protein [Ktedonobacteraceae bacterium]
MKGIIFVVWEKYLQERFGSPFLKHYRDTLSEMPEQLPVTSRVYPDEAFFKGVQTANSMSSLSTDRLLFEYGRYFILNGLVEYLCGYLLAQAWTGYDLLLLMRDAHAQMRRTPDGVMPPLFSYDVVSDDHQHMVLTYDSPRKLCSLLEGAIHGSAERFGEKAKTHQITCMKRGDAVCRMDVQFFGSSWAKKATPQMIQQEKERLSKQGLSNLILQILPPNSADSISMEEIKRAIDQHQGPYFPEIYQRQRHLEPVHVSQVYTVLAKLQQVGLVASTANKPGDTFMSRHYWLAPTTD